MSLAPPEKPAGAAPHPADVQLTGILANVDSDMLRLIGGSSDHPVTISDVVIFDPADTHAVGAGTIVLAVGLAADGIDAVRLLEHAGELAAAAVVFRTDRAVPRIEQLATELGVAVFGIPADISWGPVYSLLRTSMANSGEFQLPIAAGIVLGDLFGLADAIAAGVGGPVTIEDPQWRVLAWTGNLDYEIDELRRDTILGRRPPIERRRRHAESGLLAALREQDVVRLERGPDAGYAPRLVAGVRAGDELLGSVWVAEAGAPLGPAAERELARMAKLAAVHLLSHRAADEIKRRTRGAFVREVLEGWAPSQSTVRMARTIGPFTVLVFAVDDRSPPVDTIDRERLLSIVSLHCESRHPDAMCALIDQRIWAVLPAVQPDVTRELATRILTRAEASLGVRLVAAIGTTVASIADVPHSRRAAEQALDVLIRRPRSDRLVHIDDVRGHASLLAIIDWAAANEELTQGKLTKLREHDRDHGTRYGDTIRAYFDAGANIRVAAAQLFVHPNTLRLRLRRIVEISGLDLDDPDERLITELQLRMP